MADDDLPKSRKRLGFYPSSGLHKAFRKFMDGDKFTEESNALEFITREALTARGFLSPKKQQP